MGNDIIQADYDQLHAVAARFGGQAEANQQMMARVRQSMQPLQQGGWQGRGSAAFFAEMNGEILPAVQRLSAALNQARTVTLQIQDVMKAAEEEASQPFKGEAHAGPSPTGPGVGPGVGPGTAVNGSQVTEPGIPGSDDTQDQAGRDPRDSRQETLDLLSTLFSMPNIAVSAPSMFASGWLKSGNAGSFAKHLANNGALKWLGKGLAVVDLGFSIGKVANDPSVENFSDLGASGLGVWGAVGSSAGAHLAAAFSLGYAIGDNFIAPHTTEPLSNALLKADPLGINNNSLKYPRTTRNWYDRNNKVMPVGEAADVYQGLFNKYGRKEAEDFAKNYTQRADISMNKFRGKLPWYLAGGPTGMWGW